MVSSAVKRLRRSTLSMLSNTPSNPQNALPLCLSSPYGCVYRILGICSPLSKPPVPPGSPFPPIHPYPCPYLKSPSPCCSLRRPPSAALRSCVYPFLPGVRLVCCSHRRVSPALPRLSEDSTTQASRRISFTPCRGTRLSARFGEWDFGENKKSISRRMSHFQCVYAAFR